MLRGSSPWVSVFCSLLARRFGERLPIGHDLDIPSFSGRGLLVMTCWCQTSRNDLHLDERFGAIFRTGKSKRAAFALLFPPGIAGFNPESHVSLPRRRRPPGSRTLIQAKAPPRRLLERSARMAPNNARFAIPLPQPQKTSMQRERGDTCRFARSHQRHRPGPRRDPFASVTPFCGDHDLSLSLPSSPSVRVVFSRPSVAVRPVRMSVRRTTVPAPRVRFDKQSLRSTPLGLPKLC